MNRGGALLAAAAIATAAGPAAVPAFGASSTNASASASANANNYADPGNWLCRPGRSDACAAPTAATVLTDDGTRRLVDPAPRADAPIDCFYVYPTVSPQATPNSDLQSTGVEESTATAQFARFATQCRAFAPRYRQVTVAGLRAALTGSGAQPDTALAYRDVAQAWHHYLAHDNHGRGFVLIGHSQGAKILARLIAEQIDGRPLASQLVSAIIPGTLVEVPLHADVGGTFTSLPLCRAAADTGCVIAYSSYLAAAPAEPHPRYGVARSPDRHAACVNPARLVAPAGGADPARPSDSTPLDAVVPARLLPHAQVATPFIELPAAVRGECVTQGAQSFLAISVAEGLTIADSLAAIQGRRPDWGLHVLDINLALGTLVDILATQAQRWALHRAHAADGK